jgi:hypothetical protein
VENNQWFSKTREILNKLHDLKGIDSNKYGDVRAVFIYHVVIQYKADIDDVITELFECLKNFSTFKFYLRKHIYFIKSISVLLPFLFVMS